MVVASGHHKLREYEKSGIFLGKELIATLETQQMPLNTKYIEAFIVKHFEELV